MKPEATWKMEQIRMTEITVDKWLVEKTFTFVDY